MGYTVAVVGATGAVGAQMIKMLEESTLPIDKIRYLASARSAGKVLQFKGKDVTIEETTEDAFEGVDIALFLSLIHIFTLSGLYRSSERSEHFHA